MRTQKKIRIAVAKRHATTTHLGIFTLLALILYLTALALFNPDRPFRSSAIEQISSRLLSLQITSELQTRETHLPPQFTVVQR